MYPKKGILITLAFLLFFAQTSMVLAEETGQSEPKIWVDGQLVTPEVSPIIESGRVMVPIRFVSEALGADVKWDEETRSVIITTDHKEPSVVQEVEQETLPEEIAAWIENSQNTWLAQEKIHDDLMYLLVTYGEKPTGGYAVDIQQVVESEEEIIVKVAFTQPGEDDIVTQAITHPYDLFAMQPTEKPVVYEVIGDESYVPTLVGMETLSPIMAESRGIKIFRPAPEEKVDTSFTFEGIANVFEGNVLYRLSNEEGEELAFDFTTGAMGDWGAIEETIQIPDTVEEGEALLLEFFTESAKDGSIQDLIEIPLHVEKTL